MKKLTLVLSCALLCNFSFAQNNNELIVQFKVNEKPKSSEVLKLQKFNNPEIRSLNKSNKIKSIKLTGNKKKKDTEIIEIKEKESIFNSKEDKYHFAEEIKEEETLSIHDKELELIKKALERNNGKRKAAAIELGISERTL